MNKKRV